MVLDFSVRTCTYELRITALLECVIGRGAHVKNLWGGVGHSGPTFYKNSFAKASCHRCTDLYSYPPG